MEREMESILLIQAWHETGSKCISFAGAKKNMAIVLQP